MGIIWMLRAPRLAAYPASRSARATLVENINSSHEDMFFFADIDELHILHRQKKHGICPKRWRSTRHARFDHSPFGVPRMIS